MDNKILENKNILIIEDSLLCMSLIKAFLKGTGVNILTAVTADEGWNQFNENNVDLVITDLRLPGCTGVGLIMRLKQTKPDVPVIVQTASAIDFSEEDCRKAGCDSFITKPFSKNEFLGIINENIKKSKSSSD